MIELHYPIDYFFDKMKMYEIQTILKHYQFHLKNEWEQCRTLSYIIAQVNSSKKLKATDILQFDWDNNNNEETQTTSMTDEDIQSFREKAIQIINKNLL